MELISRSISGGRGDQGGPGGGDSQDGVHVDGVHVDGVHVDGVHAGIRGGGGGGRSVAVGFISLVAGVILVRLGLLLCYQLLGTTRPLRGESTGRAARSPLSTSARAVAVKHGGGGGMHGLQGGQHALRLTNDTPFGQRAFQVVQRAIQAGGRLGHRPCYVSVPARDADSDEDGSWASEHGPEVTATAASSYATHVGRSPPGKRAAPHSHGIYIYVYIYIYIHIYIYRQACNTALSRRSAS